MTILFALFLGTLLIIFLSILLLQVLKDLPPIDEESLIFSESTIIYDNSGKVQLYAVHGDQNRKIIPIEDISSNMISAILAAEDDQFYEHSGFDLGGISMAFCHEIFGNVFGLCPPRGGSTITQQLVKNFFLTPERTLTRKQRELVLAFKVEGKYSKDKILEIYLNGISFGSNLSGVETASQAFFGVSAKDLSAAQAAVLASLPQAPTRHSPFGENVYSQILVSQEIIEENEIDTRKKLEAFQESSWRSGLIGKEIELANNKTEYFSGRADWVLWRMREKDYITEQKYKEAEEELKNMVFDEYREELIAPHFVMWIRQLLEERFGADLVEHGGLKVYTTLDIDTQEEAENAVAEHIEKNTEQFNAKNAALVSLDPKTGYVRAMVGSADYWNDEIDGKVNVILKKRLPGSSFKPIAFAASFLTGQLSPASVLFDVETDFGNDWVPQNYDGLFRGPVSVREALGNSLNIPAIKATIIAGPEKVYELATSMGISFDFDSEFYGAAIALGGAEARPMDMAVAFSVFANGGKKVEPIGILRIEDRYGNLLYSAENTEEAVEVLDPSVAYLVTDMLADSSARGEGWNTRLQLPGRQNIAKTGTADKKVDDAPWPADCWTIGGTPQLMTAVWTGNSDGEVLAREASGFTVAAPIWHTYMTRIFEDVPEERFGVPSGVIRTQVSRLSGKLPLPGTQQNLIVDEVFSAVNVPTETDTSLTLIEIDSVSGKLPTKYTPQEAIEEKAVLSMNSYYPNFSDWEDPVQQWLSENKEELLEKFEITSDILAEMPTETDDIHTPSTFENAPTFSFQSPTENSTVAPPRITVIPNISAKNGFQKVIFYWNDRIMKSFDDDQESYIVRIPRSATGKGTLTAEIFDTLFYSDSESIEVNIGEDTDNPDVNITFPRSNTSLLGGLATTLTVDAIDDMGAIQKVEFFVDGNRLGSDLFYPYEYEWTTPNESDELILRVVAHDLAGNTRSDEVKFSVEKQAISNDFEITEPNNGEKVSCPDSIQIVAGSSSEIRNNMETFEILAEAPNRIRNVVAEFSESNPTGYFMTEFTPDTCGEWKFYAKSELRTGSQRISGKVSVNFEEEK